MPVSKTTIERPGAYHDFWEDWRDGDGVKRLSPQALRTKTHRELILTDFLHRFL